MKKHLIDIFLLSFIIFFSFSCAKKKIVKPEEPVKPPVKVEKPAIPEPVEMPALEEPKVVTDEPETRGMSFQKSGSMQTVYFDYDRFELRSDAKKQIDANFAYLKKNQKVKVQLQGHCDERGTIPYNLSLGQKRATSVRNYLIYLGIDGSRISTISFGKELPACLEHTEDCWSKNRRVEFFEKK